MKRILLLEHPQFTTATNYLWQGLKEIERRHPDRFSVSCYPYIPTHYDERQFDLRSLPWFNSLADIVERSRTDPSQLPRGIPPFHPGEVLTAQAETEILHYGHGHTYPKENVIEGEDQAVRELKEGKFDLVVLGNSHRVPTILLARLRERVKPFPTTVYLDAGERDELNEHWIHVFRPDLVFKQVLTPEVMNKGLSVQIQNYKLRMFPLPLASPLVDAPEASIEGVSIPWLREQSKSREKMLPVFYYLGNTWPARADAVRAIDAFVLRRDYSRVKGCSSPNYHYNLAMSRMAFTMRGSGRDTNRYWEICLYRTAMISDGTMGCIHPFPFEDRKTAFFYRSNEELVSILENNLTPVGHSSHECERIAIAGQDHLEKYHSVTDRAVFFLDILDQQLNFCDAGLRESLTAWKAMKRWDGRPWQGPVV